MLYRYEFSGTVKFILVDGEIEFFITYEDNLQFVSPVEEIIVESFDVEGFKIEENEWIVGSNGRLHVELVFRLLYEEIGAPSYLEMVKKDAYRVPKSLKEIFSAEM